MNRIACIVLSALLLVCVANASCTSTRSSNAYTASDESRRDSAKALRLTDQAIAVMDKDPERAERLLREALEADLFCAPAHNNLGVIYLQQGELYEAAHEFEWARKLMPSHPDPRLNLAMALEQAGRIDDALASYESALEVFPGHIPTTQALLRCQLRNQRQDSKTHDRLERVALEGDSTAWRQWAQEQIALGRGDS